MEIYINTQNILDDIGGTYLMETGDSNPIPPKGVLVQRLNEAATRLVTLLSRHMTIDLRRSADDELHQPETFVFILTLSTRKASGKAQPITDQIHSFLVNATLSKVCANMGLKEVSANHEAMATADAEIISALVHTKLPPL